MELRHLRYFIAVAEQQSFSRAAQILHVSQSSISEQVADLEAEIGVKLFARAARKTLLTQSGEVFLVHAHRVLQESKAAILETQRAEHGEVGTLRIGFYGGGLGDGFPGLIRAFRKLYPRIELSLIELTSSDQWPAFIDGRIDIGFTRIPEPEFRNELRWDVLQHDPIVAVLPKNHPKAKRKSIDVKELASERFVLASRAVSPAVHDKVFELCSTAGFIPDVASVSSVWSSVILLVRSGEGVALLPSNQQQLGIGDLVFIPLTTPNASVEMCIGWHAHRDRPLLRAFRELTRMHTKGNARL